MSKKILCALLVLCTSICLMSFASSAESSDSSSTGVYYVNYDLEDFTADFISFSQQCKFIVDFNTGETFTGEFVSSVDSSGVLSSLKIVTPYSVEIIYEDNVFTNKDRYRFIVFDDSIDYSDDFLDFLYRKCYFVPSADSNYVGLGSGKYTLSGDYFHDADDYISKPPIVYPSDDYYEINIPILCYGQDGFYDQLRIRLNPGEGDIDDAYYVGLASTDRPTWRVLFVGFDDGSNNDGIYTSDFTISFGASSVGGLSLDMYEWFVNNFAFVEPAPSDTGYFVNGVWQRKSGGMTYLPLTERVFIFNDGYWFDEIGIKDMVGPTIDGQFYKQLYLLDEDVSPPYEKYIAYFYEDENFKEVVDSFNGTFDFGKYDQYVSEEFYSWLNSNFYRVSDSELVPPYEGEVLEFFPEFFKSIQEALNSLILFETFGGVTITVWGMLACFAGLAFLIWILKMIAGG